MLTKLGSAKVHRTRWSGTRTVDWQCAAGWSIAAVLLLASQFSTAQPAAFGGPNPSELGGLEIEQLMDVKITTVARKEESVSEAAAAVTVLSQEDIHSSGYTTIPEVLRLVPGLQVARLDAHDWAISARGFNDVFANKLQVLVDGQSVYTPLFSGVFWEVQDDLVLENIDRIEVVRGPGASVWGANAVNGVINIITKSAKDSQGGLLAGYAGTEQRLLGGVRYGGTLATNIYYRAYVRYQDTASSTLETGTPAFDDWYMWRGGFRADWYAEGDNLVSFKGDLYDGQEHQVFFVPTLTPPFSQSVRDTLDLRGGNLLGKWTHTFAEDSNFQLQLYYDESFRHAVVFEEDRRNYDLDFQQRFPLGRRNDFVWGAGFRASTDIFGDTPTITLRPSSRTLKLFSSFVQDEITLIDDHLSLVLGSKFEHNDFTGFEIQPTARLLWRPSARQTVWAAVSRAVRTPSRAESDIRLNQQVFPAGVFSSNLPTVVALEGNPDFQSEKLIAYEAGYRFEFQRRVFLDLSGFYNDYSDLRSIEPAQPFLEVAPSPPHLVVPFTARNLLAGESFGGEAALSWQITDWWRLRPSYSFLEILLRSKPGSLDTTSVSAERASPRHQFIFLSSLDILPNLQFDAHLRFVDELPSLQTPEYWELDLRLAWRPHKNLELSLVGQNLLHAHHLEFNRSFVNEPRTEIDRGVYGKIMWQF